MTSGITVPLAAVSAGIGVTANAASEFDTGMRRVATMLPGITDTGFKDISNQALTLSKDFGSSTADMTDAMYQALSSGVPQDNIFSFMQEAEKLAIGGATDVVTSTDVLTTAVNSYGAANLSTAQASDILFAGTKFGKSTVEELAASLADVVPVAASLGIGFGDVNASLATMTIQGTPTAQATTQLRAILFVGLQLRNYGLNVISELSALYLLKIPELLTIYQLNIKANIKNIDMLPIEQTPKKTKI
jgi:TP901 family phage tail tape measure protein